MGWSQELFSGESSSGYKIINVAIWHLKGQLSLVVEECPIPWERERDLGRSLIYSFTWKAGEGGTSESF